jgi:hypothetical protein
LQRTYPDEGATRHTKFSRGLRLPRSVDKRAVAHHPASDFCVLTSQHEHTFVRTHARAHLNPAPARRRHTDVIPLASCRCSGNSIAFHCTRTCRRRIETFSQAEIYAYSTSDSDNNNNRRKASLQRAGGRSETEDGVLARLLRHRRLKQSGDSRHFAGRTGVGDLAAVYMRSELIERVRKH